MAVTDDGLSYPTDSLISNKDRKRYKVSVKSHHWQLRSLISAEKDHVVYFPGGEGSRDIQRLDTETQECETIKELLFAPRCLVAGNGWLCCGSEHGEFVFFRLADDGADDFLPPDIDSEVQSPMDGGSLARAARASYASRRSRSSMNPIAPMAKGSKLAKERVNCITLWSPPTRFAPHDNAYTFPVAVLANNDRTVTLVNLEDAEEKGQAGAFETVQYPDYVNRALISPDGRLLVAILDDPYLYVHERAEKSPESRPMSGPEGSWKLKQKILLKSQKRDDRSNNRGSFAACFSSWGAYFAVGTQHGTVSIFDTSLLSQPKSDALITTFTSSNPETSQGAIRDMAFSPGPFDILAWSEDRGNIGLADSRQNFAFRQIIDINGNGDVEHIDLIDRTTVDPRLLDRRRGHRDANDSAAGSPDADSSEGQERDSAVPSGRTSTIDVEAMRNERRRRERPSHRDPSSTDNASPNIHVHSDGGRRVADFYARLGGVSSNPSSQDVSNLLSHYRTERVRNDESNPQLLRVYRNASNSQRPDPLRRGEAHRRLDWSEDNTAAADSAGNAEASRERRFRPQPPAVMESLESLLLSNQLDRPLRASYPETSVLDGPSLPDNTAGLSWSEDGRHLFVGAENGIYQFSVNIQARKLAPSFSPR